MPKLKQNATWTLKVRDCLQTQLPDGEPSAKRIAQALHLSLRSLQRHLADEGNNNKSLLAETRQTLTLQHIHAPRCSISEIAYLLGFADTSSFSRTLKRWTGQAPSR